MTSSEAVAILEEVKTLEDSMYAFNQTYCDALDIAIEALKSREPRILDINELEEGMAVWVDRREWFDFVIGSEVCRLFRKDGYMSVHFAGVVNSGNESSNIPPKEYGDYGITWRCWSEMPTVAQKQAAKWDGEDDDEFA